MRPTALVPTWTSAVSRPSCPAPSATRCTVGVRPPTVRNTASRVSASRTGRFVARAASTASRVPAQTEPFPPKPPPT